MLRLCKTLGARTESLLGVLTVCREANALEKSVTFLPLNSFVLFSTTLINYALKIIIGNLLSFFRH